MDIRYSDHAIGRLMFRKMEKIWIEEAIQHPSILRRIGNKFFAQKKLNGLTIEVVYTKEKYISVKTAYWV